MPVKIVPEGYHTITPYLMVNDAVALIDFVKRVFDGEELERVEGPDGVIRHAEVRVNDSRVMIAQAFGEWKAMPCSMYVYLANVDEVYQRALDAGATSIMPPMDMFYGDRSGGVTDPTGNVWWIATHKEDVSSEELKRRAAEQLKK